MKVVYYEIDSTPSTNETAKNLAHLWNPHTLTVISTKKQTQGKGKFNRAWLSSDKDITLSFCFFLTELDIDVSQLFRLGTEAVLSLLQDWGIQGTIKWPNDVLVHNQKLCGVLSETVPIGNHLFVVIGIGINGNSSQQELAVVDQPATSLAVLLNQEVNLTEIHVRLTEHMKNHIVTRFHKILAKETNSGDI